MRLSQIPSQAAAMASQRNPAGMGRISDKRRMRQEEPEEVPELMILAIAAASFSRTLQENAERLTKLRSENQAAAATGLSAGAGGLGLSAGDGPDSGPGAGPAAPKAAKPKNPILGLLAADKDAAIEEENAIASVQDKRVAEFFRVRPDMALAFGVSPSRELGIARRAMASINIVNESVRADFMSNAMIQPEEKKSAKEFRWKKDRTLGDLVTLLKTAPDVHTALGITPDADPEGAAAGSAKAQIGALGKSDLGVLSKAAPAKDLPPLPEWKEEIKEEMTDLTIEDDDDSPRPF